MRERLIELMMQIINNQEGMVSATEMADHLLANGVIVPPCKVGDTVYFVGLFTGQTVGQTVEAIFYSRNDITLALNNTLAVSVEQQLGKTVFLTREEAEQALKERDGS